MIRRLIFMQILYVNVNSLTRRSTINPTHSRMGGVPSNMLATWTRPDEQPDFAKPPTFDPLLGFPEGRKQRVMKISHEEMEAASVPHKYRDYCAHLYVDYFKCRNNNAPWFKACAHEKHDYDQCQYEDWLLRMKEYEREKRLKKMRKVQQAEML